MVIFRTVRQMSLFSEGALVFAPFGKKLWPGVVDEFEGDKHMDDEIRVVWLDKACTTSWVKKPLVHSAKSMLHKCSQKKNLSEEMKGAIKLMYKLVILPRFDEIPSESRKMKLSPAAAILFDAKSNPKFLPIDREGITDSEVDFLMDEGAKYRDWVKKKKQKKVLPVVLDISDRICLYKCAECEQRYGDEAELARHSKNEHTENVDISFGSSFCEQEAVQDAGGDGVCPSPAVLQDCWVQLDAVPVCQQCHMPFADRVIYEEHMAVHLGWRWMCKEFDCSALFNTLKDVQWHFGMFHPQLPCTDPVKSGFVKRKKFEMCELCGEGVFFETVEIQRQHVHEEHTERVATKECADSLDGKMHANGEKNAAVEDDVENALDWETDYHMPIDFDIKPSGCGQGSSRRKNVQYRKRVYKYEDMTGCSRGDERVKVVKNEGIIIITID